MVHVNVILFNGFETLDAFGPVEIIGKMPKLYHLDYYSLHGGQIVSSDLVPVCTKPFFQISTGGILLIPGGMATRSLVHDADFIHALKGIALNAEFVLSVCTGSALLAKTGLLDGRRATSNKTAFDWVESVNTNVHWEREARWVVDGNTYTSSGVSAGMDMALGFISDKHGYDTAVRIANDIEYLWNSDRANDPFAR